MGPFNLNKYFPHKTHLYSNPYLSSSDCNKLKKKKNQTPKRIDLYSRAARYMHSMERVVHEKCNIEKNNGFLSITTTMRRTFRTRILYWFFPISHNPKSSQFQVSIGCIAIPLSTQLAVRSVAASKLHSIYAS